MSPSETEGGTAPPVPSTRSTAFSPKCVGKVETRKSTPRFSSVTRMRPSWGTRRSAMSSLARIFSRETNGPCSHLGTCINSRSRPSTRVRTCTPCSRGSMWMSLAPILIPSWMMRLTILTTGGSCAWLRASPSGTSSSSPSRLTICNSSFSLTFWRKSCNQFSGA